LAGFSQTRQGGGNFQPFTNIFERLIPILNEKGFMDKDWNQLLVENPRKAFDSGSESLGDPN
jgi:phosphotriesterase-related protein